MRNLFLMFFLSVTLIAQVVIPPPPPRPGGGSSTITNLNANQFTTDANSAVVIKPGALLTNTVILNMTLAGNGQMDVGAAGVRITGDGDGAITFLGLGNGSDEDFTINLDDTPNTAVISSSTGLNVFNFSGITLQQSGAAVASAATTITITGTANEITSSAGAQDMSANRTWTLSLPTALTFTGKTVTGGTFSGVVHTGNTDFGTAGVRVTNDGDGAMTWLGMGDGSDEDLTWNLDDTADAVVVSSSTSVASIRFTGISLQPSANDGAALGNASRAWSDLFLADGAVLNFDNGAGTITFVTSTDTFTVGGAANWNSSVGTTTIGALAGTIDAGGATSFEMPNAAAPTVDAFGEIAGDNNLWASGRGAPVFFDGTAAVALVGVLVSDTPSNGQVPTWNTGGTITWETPSASGSPGGSVFQLQYNNTTFDGASGIFTDASETNLTVTGTYFGNSATLTNGLATGSSGTAGYVRLFDTDGDHGITLHSHATTTTDLDVFFPSAPFTGLLKGTVSSTTNWALAQAVSNTDYAPVADPVFTGSLQLPNGASVTTDAFGELGGDNNAWASGRGAIQVFDGTANTLLIGVLSSDTPSNGQVAKWNTGGTITWEDDNNSGSATAWDLIADPSASSIIALGATTNQWTSTLDGGNVMSILNTDADLATDTSGLVIGFYDGADANGYYLRMIGDVDNSPTIDFAFNQVTGFTSLLPINPPAETYGSGWNADTGAAQKDNIYDILHVGDTDDNGKPDVIDIISTAGFFAVSAGGVPVQGRTLTEGLAIDITNPTGASGDPTIAFDPTELTGNRTFGDGGDASIIWTFNLSGTDTTLTISSGKASWSGFQLPSAAGSSTLAAAGDIAFNSTGKVLGLHNGTKEVGIGTIYHQTWAFDPKAVYDSTLHRLFLMTIGPDAPNGITVVRWNLSFDADPTAEIDLDLKRADAFIGVANSAVMDVLDTTAGASSETTAANINSGAVVANGKVMYLEFGASYAEASHVCIFELFWEVEED